MTDLELAVKMFMEPGQAKELRFLTATGIWSAICDKPTRALSIAKDFGAAPDLAEIKACWWTLNPIDPATLKYIDNDINIFPKFAIANRNILTRSWLLIDVDPERPSGTNATKEEKVEARKVTRNIWEFLNSQGWPEPVCADSGNGFHLIYRITLPTFADDMVRNVLRALAWKFDSPQAKVDQTVYNAGRVCKIPGTWARKGPHSDQRPHRLSKFIYVPKAIKLVAGRQLAALPADFPPPPMATGDAPRFSAERLQEMFDAYEDEIELGDTEEKADGTYYYLSMCPFNGAPHTNQERKKTAIIDYKAGDNRGSRQKGGLVFKCFADQCADHNFKDFLDLMEERTGISFDPDDPEVLAAKWGGIEAV